MELPVIHIGNTGIRVGLWKKGSILALFILSFLIDTEVEITALAVGYISLEFRREIGTGNTTHITDDSKFVFF